MAAGFLQRAVAVKKSYNNRGTGDSSPSLSCTCDRTKTGHRIAGKGGEDGRLRALVFSCSDRQRYTSRHHPTNAAPTWVRERSSEKMNVVVTYLTLPPIDGCCTALCST